MHRRARVTPMLLLAVLAVSCSSGRVATPALPDRLPGHTILPRPLPPSPDPVAAKPRPRAVAGALTAYGDCRTLVRTLRREAAREVGPYGFNQVYVGGGTAGGPMAVAMGGGAMAGSATGGSAAGAGAPVAAPAPAPGYSGTNNQEAGVDEPDLVKTDGKVIVALQQGTGTLQVIDAVHARVLGRLPLFMPGGGRLLLMGSTVVALGQLYDAQGPAAVARVVDIGDATHPHIARTYRTEGSLVDARLVAGRVLLVVQSSPHFAFAPPVGATTAAAAAATRANQRLVRRATTRQWLPALTVQPGGAVYRPSCGQVMHPGVESGIATTTVITLDPARAAPTHQLTVVASGSVVYASTSALYLATRAWDVQQGTSDRRQRDITTDVHGFAVASPDHVSYVGSGSVTGTLTDQYSLSEHNGDLRVATTVGSLLPPPGEGTRPAALSDNRVTVLRPTDGVLLQVGQVTGLGRGERIYGVRFVGDIGYVVTFRQTDPLYVLDLGDPRRPRMVGELHVTGFSSSLYPLGEGRLLGIGQAVDAHLRQVGTQLSVFDVRRLRRPTLRSKVVLDSSSSMAESDHHALLWWPASHLLVVPMTTYAHAPFQGTIVYDVSARGSLREIGRIRPQPSSTCCGQGIFRTVVVGNLLYSVTESGMVVSGINRLDKQVWLPFR
jgi:uncharacterized secreted protein with C-terminal beta-propeller domain